MAATCDSHCLSHHSQDRRYVHPQTTSQRRPKGDAGLTNVFLDNCLSTRRHLQVFTVADDDPAAFITASATVRWLYNPPRHRVLCAVRRKLNSPSDVPSTNRGEISATATNGVAVHHHGGLRLFRFGVECQPADGHFSICALRWTQMADPPAYQLLCMDSRRNVASAWPPLLSTERNNGRPWPLSGHKNAPCIPTGNPLLPTRTSLSIQTFRTSPSTSAIP